MCFRSVSFDLSSARSGLYASSCSFSCQLLQRLQFAVVKLVDSLCFFVCFDFCAMLLIEFC